MRVIVVGAGIWGLATAYACAKSGDSVTVYDENLIGYGASGGIVGALAPHVPDQWNPKKAFQFEALDTAAGFWSEIDTLSGSSSGYGRIGRIQPLVSEKAKTLALSRQETAKELWQGRYEWTVQNPPSYLSASCAPNGVVYDTLSARIHPAAATQSLAKACTSKGVTLNTNHRVDEITDHSISGPWGQDSADIVIISAGVSGFDLIAPFVGKTAGTGVKGQAALFKFELLDAPQIYADGVYIIPHANGTVAVGSTSENTWDHDGTDVLLETVIEKAFDIYPALKDQEIVQRWSGVRPKARKRDPMLGWVPNVKGIYSVMGAFKIGFGLSHKIGTVVAADIRGADVDIPTSFTLDWHLSS